MAGTREIQSRIKSIKDTMKITNAMYMISSNKLRRAKAALENTEPYFYALQAAIARILRHIPDVKHPYFNGRENIKKEERKIGYLVITADKGLAGAYNHNVIKLAESEIEKHEGISRLYVVGQLGVHYFKKKKWDIDTHFQYTAQNPSMNRARNISEKLIEDYMQGRLDTIYIIYTRMSGASKEETVFQRILPLRRQDFKEADFAGVAHMEEIEMLPSPEMVIHSIGTNCVAGFIYGALVESYCCEQNARVMAMSSANDSAKEMLNNLSIEYNRLRQANITREITEIISGVNAQKRKRK